MEFYGVTDVGKLRLENQDSFYCENENWCILADGMGGHNGGQTASKLAIDVISNHLKDYDFDNSVSLITKAITEANTKIYETANNNSDLVGMGTTVVVLGKNNNSVIVAHAGDSRAYLISKNEIRQITKDHSLVQELVDSNTITKEEAKLHPQKNIITRALGTEPNIKIDINEVDINKDDYILICSDGLSNMVSNEEIFEIVNNEKSITDAGNKLIELANNNGGFDNITVIIAKM